MVALRPFFKAARTSAKPSARWIRRVSSFRSFAGLVIVAEVFAMMRRQL